MFYLWSVREFQELKQEEEKWLAPDRMTNGFSMTARAVSYYCVTNLVVKTTAIYVFSQVFGSAG